MRGWRMRRARLCRCSHLVAVHSSYLLCLPDEDAKAHEYELSVRDLKMAAALLSRLKSAA